MKNGEGWRYSLGFATVPAIMIVIGTIFLPDSPSSRIERGQDDKGKKEPIKIRGTPDVDEKFNDLVAASETSKAIKHPWTCLLKRQYWSQLTMTIAIPFFQQLTNMNVMAFYAPVLLKTIGFGSTASLMSAMITGGCNALATLVSIGTVDKFGRHTLFLEVVTIASKFGVDGNPGELPKWYALLVVLGICIYVMGFAWSWGSLAWLVPSQIFPLERSAAQSINVFVKMIFTFAIAQIFTSMLYHMKFGLFIFFAFFVVLMSLFINKFLPETKGVLIKEMSVVWQNHPYWRKFVKPADKVVEEP